MRMRRGVAGLAGGDAPAREGRTGMAREWVPTTFAGRPLLRHWDGMAGAMTYRESERGGRSARILSARRRDGAAVAGFAVSYSDGTIEILAGLGDATRRAKGWVAIGERR